ncbi:MAG: divergent PAP2 family protein [Eubacterium sp.]|nr:divergent PAP2 family protein [Eubacterium sp.]
MEYINQIVSNRILISGLIGWASAQLLKTIIFLIVNKRLQLERLFGDGGMPSGHSATVSAVAISTGLESGFASPIFALATILAIIVMHDAMGVRFETGKQAKVLNEMTELIEKLSGTELSNEDKLKEFVGHTPLQVLMGCVLGLFCGVILHL